MGIARRSLAPWVFPKSVLALENYCAIDGTGLGDHLLLKFLGSVFYGGGHQRLPSGSEISVKIGRSCYENGNKHKSYAVGIFLGVTSRYWIRRWKSLPHRPRMLFYTAALTWLGKVTYVIREWVFLLLYSCSFLIRPRKEAFL